MVSAALFTGLSGMRSQQRSIEVISNNLANVSTPGFWSSRPVFGDILSFTLRSGSGPSANFGGQNPMQVGLGTQLTSIDMNTEQGTFQNTGRALDVAIQGKGFFTLTDGLRTFYTRVGTFGVDAQRTLVDLRSGYRVVNSSGANIEVPLTDTLPPQATNTVDFQGNLPATVSGPLEEIVESNSPFLSGTAATKSASPPSGTTYDMSSFVSGTDTILVEVNGGAKTTVTIPPMTASPPPFANASAATASEIAALFAGIPGLTTSVNTTTGTIDFSTVQLGSSATLKFDDGPTSSGVLAALGLNATLQSGSQSPATTSTNLANLTTRVTPYQNGDQISVTGTNPDGTQVSNTFTYGTDGTTIGDLINFLNSTFDPTQVTASLEASGVIRMTAVNKQPASLSLSIADVSGNTGQNTYPSFATVQDGTGPDTAVTSIDIIDSLGRAHTVTMTFTRTTADPTVWDMVASMDPSSGTVTQNTISSIRFNEDGSFNVIGGSNQGLTFVFDGISAAQSVNLNFGTPGTFEGIAMVGNSTTIAAIGQDGFTTGNLLNVAFEATGNLLGFYSNGQTRAIDTLRITMFPNESGLLRVGDTLFVESPNSEDAISTTATSAGAGIIRPGALENSNVDIADEFVKLITAQRGFQANSRVITTADEILAELVNIVR